MRKIILKISLLMVFITFSSILNAQENKARIDVMYFHATTRCHGCIVIEENTKNSINTLYEKQLKDSTITLTSIDFLQPENEHFQDDYKFESQTLILSKKVNGKEVKWVNLDKIWDYSSDYNKYKNYIEEEIKKLLVD